MLVVVLLSVVALLAMVSPKILFHIVRREERQANGLRVYSKRWRWVDGPRIVIPSQLCIPCLEDPDLHGPCWNPTLRELERRGLRSEDTLLSDQLIPESFTCTCHCKYAREAR